MLFASTLGTSLPPRSLAHHGVGGSQGCSGAVGEHLWALLLPGAGRKRRSLQARRCLRCPPVPGAWLPAPPKAFCSAARPCQRLSSKGDAGEGNGADGGAGRASGHCEEGMSRGDPGCWPCEEEGARQLLLGACPAVTCSGEGIEALPVAAGCRPENSTPLPEGHRASSQSRSCCLLHILAQEL